MIYKLNLNKKQNLKMSAHLMNQEINTDFLLNQLRVNISSMDNNSRTLERLNKKFISFQQE